MVTISSKALIARSIPYGGAAPPTIFSKVTTPLSHMFPPQFVELCGTIAPFCAFAVFLAPLPTMMSIRKSGSVGNLPLLPYTSMLMSTFMWTVYGVLKKEKHVWLTNIVGIVLALYYFFEFIRFAPKAAPTLPGSVSQHGQAILGTTAATLLLCVSGIEATTGIVGTAAVTLCIAMFSSPLAALKVVLQTKSAKAIPLPFTVASIANCFCWTVFGLFRMKDPNIYVTNALGLSFGIMQAAVKVIFGSGDEATPLPL